MHRYTGKFFFFHFSTFLPFALPFSLSLVPSYVDRVQYRSRFSNTKPRSRVLIIIATAFDAVSYLQIPCFDI